MSTSTPKDERHCSDLAIEIVCGNCGSFLGMAVRDRPAIPAPAGRSYDDDAPGGPGLLSLAGAAAHWSKVQRQCKSCPGTPRVSRARVVAALDEMAQAAAGSVERSTCRARFAIDDGGGFQRVQDRPSL